MATKKKTKKFVRKIARKISRWEKVVQGKITTPQKHEIAVLAKVKNDGTSFTITYSGAQKGYFRSSRLAAEAMSAVADTILQAYFRDNPQELAKVLNSGLSALSQALDQPQPKAPTQPTAATPTTQQ